MKTYGKYSAKDIISKIDHTLLSRTATDEQIYKLCDEALTYGTASVCIPLSYVRKARDYAGDKLNICTVIGFPNGYSTVEAKCFEAEDAVMCGADEVDMVINTNELKNGNYDYILDEINRIKKACHGKLLKVIVETCLLSEEEKIKISDVVAKSDAEFIKTSTGFSTGGATREDVAILCKYCTGKEVKAAGGIRSVDDAVAFLDLGATRLGTSSLLGMILEDADNSEEKLVKIALEAAKSAYSPYSGYCVGAALMAKSGKIYTGCNIENASYSPSVCAERVAFFKAVSQGEREFSMLAVVGGKDANCVDYFMPCGVCRQVMREFCPLDFRIVVGKDNGEYKIYTLDEILPHSFSKDAMK